MAIFIQLTLLIKNHFQALSQLVISHIWPSASSTSLKCHNTDFYFIFKTWTKIHPMNSELWPNKPQKQDTQKYHHD